MPIVKKYKNNNIEIAQCITPTWFKKDKNYFHSVSHEPYLPSQDETKVRIFSNMEQRLRKEVTLKSSHESTVSFVLVPKLRCHEIVIY